MIKEFLAREILQGKKEVKLSLFSNDMILHLKDSKNSTKKHSKVAEYKVSTQKSVAFLYPNNE
jgi:hypothetical protein